MRPSSPVATSPRTSMTPAQLIAKTFPPEQFTPAGGLARVPPVVPRPRPARTITATRSATQRPRYDRQRDLPRLLPLWPAEIADDSSEGQERILAKLRRALRKERQRGVAGHWAYDLARHAQLHRAYQHEKSRRVRASGSSHVVRLSAERASLSGASRGPSSSPAASVLPRSSAPPSGSSAAGPTSAGTGPATTCSGS